jgi:hypothetical protein
VVGECHRFRQAHCLGSVGLKNPRVSHLLLVYPSGIYIFPSIALVSRVLLAQKAMPGFTAPGRPDQVDDLALSNINFAPSRTHPTAPASSNQPCWCRRGEKAPVPWALNEGGALPSAGVPAKRTLADARSLRAASVYLLQNVRIFASTRRPCWNWPFS